MKNRSPAPRWRSLVIFVSAMVALSVYLFVKAPAPLEASPRAAATIPIRTVFSLLELENDAARALWTEEIVNRGGAHGLVFREQWRDAHVHAGPLPALFLRETARNLERSGMRLTLFLGSHYPINAANQLTGQQATYFDALATTGAPQFFFETATSLQTAMFADRAVVEACVTCHNEHADSPKKDWQLHSIMGATTWMYPEEAVSAERAVEMLGALRASIRAAYASYLEKVKTFDKRPTIGDRWPKDGFYLPSEEVFMRELARRTSPTTLQGLLEPGWAEAAATRAPPAASPEKPRAADKAPPPTLIIRATQRATRLTVDQGGSRIMVTRLPAGATTTLTVLPPLRVILADKQGVEVEYRGERLALPEPDNETGDVELVIASPIEKS